MSKMKKIISNSLEDGIKPKLAYYTCPQIDCNESYISEIETCFEECIIDHTKRDEKLHIYKHCSENSHLHVWLDNFQIVSRNYVNGLKTKIGEALVINELKPSLTLCLPRDTGIPELQ